MLDKIVLRDFELTHPFVQLAAQPMTTHYVPRVYWDEKERRFIPRSEEEIARLLRETTIGSWLPADKDRPVIEEYFREVGCDFETYKLARLPQGTILRNEPPNAGLEIHQDNTDELCLTTIVYLQNNCRGGALKFYEGKEGKNHFSMSTHPQSPDTCRVVSFPSNVWHKPMKISVDPKNPAVQAKNACILLSRFERK